uniref:Reverse transcriptase Ty1/copia-type domain-containing protein n=1 Tax=Peronospora matthiolae TaxID=2874970 RepID=A0AAV1UXY6_9STRA
MDEELRALEDNDVWKVEVAREACPTHQMGVQNPVERRGRDRSFQSEACGMRERAGLRCRLRVDFAAVMELSTVKVILVLALRWGVPARHGDIPNAYVKANKEEHLEIFLAYLKA